ncbi:MAG TPA: hypothetical protein DCY27_11650 [Desulfobacterales bacterium]|nr:hypothetical protein [Desulfobacterales bacterium]
MTTKPSATLNRPAFRALILLLTLCPALSYAAAKKPEQTWEPSGETYLLLPVGQDVRYAASNRTVSADAWGLGYRLLGSREGVSRTAALQIQRLTVSDTAAGVDGGFYMAAIQAGGEFISPLSANNLRFTLSAMGEFGLAGGDLYMAPVLTIGGLYQVKSEYDQPSGLHLSLFYRLTEITAGDAAGKSGKVKPVLGLRLGFAFPGFWLNK